MVDDDQQEAPVHLVEARCDGSGHGWCQAACLMYWKTAWLRPVEADEAAGRPSPSPAGTDGRRLLPLLTTAARRPPAEDGSEVYRCQATELLRAAPDGLPVRDLSQFVQDVRTGNFGVCQNCHESIEVDRVMADQLVTFCLGCLTPAQQRGLEQDLELAARMQVEASTALDLSRESKETLEMYGVGRGPSLQAVTFRNPGPDNYARRCIMGAPAG